VPVGFFKGRFSNWAFGSSSFSFFLWVIVTHPGHVSLRSLGDADGIAARMCRIGSGEPCFGTRFSLRSSHFRLLPQTSSGEGRPRSALAIGVSDHAMPSTCAGRNSVVDFHSELSRAASLGVVAALVLAATNRRLSIEMLLRAIEGTMRTTAMIMLIVLAAMFLNFVLSVIGLTNLLANYITDLGLSPMQTMIVIVLGFLVLGCFMEAFSLLLIATPLIAPIVSAKGFDLVWFDILMMLLLETALITPPIGVNLYVIQGVRGAGSMNDVTLGALPFVIAMLVMIVALLMFPQIALWLPEAFG
jgi:hypothetical protein